MIITAHAGCDGTPPNSVEFLQYAFASKADAIEVDVRTDGKTLVLSHDDDFAAPVSLRQAFEMLKLFPGKLMNCDLKQDGLDVPVYDLAVACGVERQLIYTGSVNRELFVKGKCVLPFVRWYANIDVLRPGIWAVIDPLSDAQKLPYLLEVLHAVHAYACCGINWHYALTALVADAARENNIGMSVWTIDDPAVMRDFLMSAPDNITTNRVQLMMEMIAEYRNA
ncbi:MAG: glycerophosphodiester phosphodiesterase [Clostridia bacterium]|nr:glycerophosphodiester phosphodiesterase [Clostridia bacterium]